MPVLTDLLILSGLAFSIYHLFMLLYSVKHIIVTSHKLLPSSLIIPGLEDVVGIAFHIFHSGYMQKPSHAPVHQLPIYSSVS